MVLEHDYKNFPELTDSQLEEFGFTSPFPQITEDFEADVVKVHDGDTITLRTTFRDFDFPLRFLDIDSPELNNGGAEAREWLKGQIEGEKVQIQIDRNNRVGKYGRLLGRVIHRGLNMGNTELRLGYAKAFGKKLENSLPTLERTFNLKQWFK